MSVLPVNHSFICDCHSDSSAAADVHSSPDLHKDCRMDFWFSSSVLCSTWALTHTNLTVATVFSFGGWGLKLSSTGCCCFERSSKLNKKCKEADIFAILLLNILVCILVKQILIPFLNPCVWTCALAHWVSLGSAAAIICWINDKLVQLGSAVPNRCYCTTALGLFLCIAKMIEKARDSQNYHCDRHLLWILESVILL